MAGGVVSSGVTNLPPAAVYKTNPPADDRGRIAGTSPLAVTFNLCQSSDPDPGDELKFTYDFDADGTTDSLGSCRTSHTYDRGADSIKCATSRVCVSDRQPDHGVCREYEVCALRGTRSGVFGSLSWSTVEQGGARWTRSADGLSVRVDFEDSLECGGSNRSEQIGVATGTLVLNQPGVLVITAGGRGERTAEDLQIFVDGLVVAEDVAGPVSGPCNMRGKSAGATVELSKGTHTIVVRADTIDGIYHLGAFWQVSFDVQ
jgi:LSD1 subclass zinc finger protein